jgi:transposase InsO family protein
LAASLANCELIERRRFKTKTEACLVVFTVVGGGYNPRRRYSALGYRSPMNVEWQHCDKASTQTMTIDYEQRA